MDFAKDYAKVLPLVQMVIGAAASVVYALAGDYRRAIYWMSAAIITASVTL